jgi:hypothetical protein
MVVWVIVIILIAVAQIICVQFTDNTTYMNVLSIATLITALGILYRIRVKQKLAKLETLEQKARQTDTGKK